MGTKGGRALLDTNVLVDATDTKRPRHRVVLDLLERGTGLLISAQVAREYLAVATRPIAANGLGLGLDDAIANLQEYRRVARLLPEERPLLPALLSLLKSARCEGKSIHDALLVATMQVHRVRVLITSNPSHFARFAGLIEIVEPASAL
ncbi:MAG: type II toxin-antitoxin system VapC family toxin [Myxococcales bacterium]|nr:type II toxin-antitoxin system VapC family toxin [Myxococcales bacterium]